MKKDHKIVFLSFLRYLEGKEYLGIFWNFLAIYDLTTRGNAFNSSVTAVLSH